jgi:hypothetical protein
VLGQLGHKHQIVHHDLLRSKREFALPGINRSNRDPAHRRDKLGETGVRAGPPLCDWRVASDTLKEPEDLASQPPHGISPLMGIGMKDRSQNYRAWSAWGTSRRGRN